jgi:hypothetical protein
MSAHSAVYIPALVLGIVLLIIVAAFGAIVAFAFPNRRPSFSYFAGGMTAEIEDEDDITQHRVSVL